MLSNNLELHRCEGWEYTIIYDELGTQCSLAPEVRLPL